MIVLVNASAKHSVGGDCIGEAIGDSVANYVGSSVGDCVGDSTMTTLKNKRKLSTRVGNMGLQPSGPTCNNKASLPPINVDTNFN
jgi:hypothetical protein